MIDHHDTTGGPYYTEEWRNHFSTRMPLFKGGGKPPKAPKPIKMPAPPKIKLPERRQLWAADLPPPPVPAPQQTTTTDQGMAEDDARTGGGGKSAADSC